MKNQRETVDYEFSKGLHVLSKIPGILRFKKFQGELNIQKIFQGDFKSG